MTAKSLFRSILYPVGHAKLRREQRQRFLEAVNHFCKENQSDIIIRRRRETTTVQPQVLEDELSDYLYVSIELVSSLNYCAFVFGNVSHSKTGSLIDRLWDFKRSTGSVGPESFREMESRSWELSAEWYGGHLGLGMAWSPKPRSSFELFEDISKAIASMAHWQRKINLTEKDQFFLAEEHKYNFVSSFVWGAAVLDLKPRLTDEEIERRWNDYGSPSAKERALRKRDEEYEDYVLSKAGVFDLEQQIEKDRDEEWNKAKEFEEMEVNEWKSRILRPE